MLFKLLKNTFITTLLYSSVINFGFSKSIVETADSKLDVSSSIKLGNLESSFFSNHTYKYLYLSVLYEEEINGGWKTILFSDYTYNSILNTSYYFNNENNIMNNNYYNTNNQIGLLYLGASHYKYGKLLYGNTPSVYYSGFVGSWFEPNGGGGNEVINPSFNGDLLGTKNPSNTIFYSNNLDNLKISFQFSGNSDLSENLFHDSNLTTQLSRDYGAGISTIYAIGPLYMGASYLSAKITDSLQDAQYNFHILSIGTMLNFIGGIYSALGATYEVNRFAQNTKAVGVSYILSYDYGDDGLGFIPQITYGYKKYLEDEDSNLANSVAYNYIYTTLFYNVSSNFALFADIKWDIRTSNNVEATKNYYQQYNINLQYIKENSLMLGIKYDVY